MGAGNINSKGQKKNNHPFQFKVLKLLGKIAEGNKNVGDTTTITEFNPAQLSAFGELLVTDAYPITQGTFEYTVDNTELVTNTVSNSGTVTQADAMAVISTGTTANSVAMLQTKKQAKYRSGSGLRDRFTTLFTSPSADTYQVAGMADKFGAGAIFSNGFCIGYNELEFGAFRFYNDTLDFIPLSNWDDPLDGSGASGMTIDTTKLNVWQLRLQFLGAGSLQIFIESDQTDTFVLVHNVSYANQNTVPSSYNPNYRHTLFTFNDTTINDIILKSASYDLRIEGPIKHFETYHPQQNTGLQVNAAVTGFVPLFTIRNKTTYAGKTNFVDILLDRVSCLVSLAAGPNYALVYFYKNATITGPTAWTDINISDSIAEIDVASTGFSAGKLLVDYALPGTANTETENITDYEFILNPGETVTCAVFSQNSALVGSTLLWKELF